MDRDEIIQRLKSFEKEDSNYEIFGANTHRYAVYLPMETAIIRNYETSHQILLPIEFVDFYTQISNGGAGPFYGLYSDLRDLTIIPTSLIARKCLEIDVDSDQIELEDIKQLVATNQSMKALVEALGETQALIKLLEIGEYGCGYFIYLVVSGQDYGKVALGINYQEAETENRTVSYPAYDIIYPDFNSYFKDWLDRILSHQLREFVKKKK